MQQLYSFRAELVGEEGHARQIAARPIEAGHEPACDRVLADNEHNGNGVGSGFGRLHRRSVADDHLRLAAHQISRQGRKSVQLIVGPALLDGDVLTFDKPGLFETLAQLIDEMGEA